MIFILFYLNINTLYITYIHIHQQLGLESYTPDLESTIHSYWALECPRQVLIPDQHWYSEKFDRHTSLSLSKSHPVIHAAIATVTKETVAVKWITLICSTKIDSSVFLAVYFHTKLKLEVLMKFELR